MNSPAKLGSPIPILFMLAALATFVLGGLAGIPLAYNAADLYVHDTYYIIAHLPNGFAPALICAAFAALYYWFPRLTGRTLNQPLAHAHFWLSLIFATGVLLPMLLHGRLGVHRRWYAGSPASEPLLASVTSWNTVMSVSSWLLAAAQLLFIYNLIWSFSRNCKVP